MKRRLDSWILAPLMVSLSVLLAACAGSSAGPTFTPAPTPFQTPTLATASSEKTSPGAASHVRTGTWGGEQGSLVVDAVGATIEFGCAHGVITQQLSLNSEGRFSVAGTYTQEPGIVSQDAPPEHPALYTGTVSDQAITMTVTLTDDSQQLGPFVLTYGQPSRLKKCM